MITEHLRMNYMSGVLEPVPEIGLKRGQILLFNGYGYSMEPRYVVLSKRTATSYNVAHLDGSGFGTVNHVRPEAEKFGIGTYYRDGHMMAECELQELERRTAENVRIKAAKDAEEKRRAEKELAEALAKGSDIIPELPADAKAVIVADFMEDESDPMTDYFGASCRRRVYLAFSKHTRALFPEMRKAAAKFEGTAYLSAKDSPEHRENYSMGAGNYLGNKRSGWMIYKEKIYNREHTLKELQRAAGEGRYFM